MIYKDKLPDIFPPVVGLDIETDSLDRFRSRIIGVGVSDGKNTYIIERGFDRLIPLLEHKGTTKVIHDAGFDLPTLCSRFSCRPQNIWDSLIVERVLNNGRDIPNALDAVSARRLGEYMDKSVRAQFADHAGPMTDEQLKYLEKDCAVLPRIRLSQIDDTDAELKPIVELENRLTIPVLDMTLTGVGFRSERWEGFKGEIRDTLCGIEQQMEGVLGSDFTLPVERNRKGEKITETIPFEDIKWGAWPQLKALLNGVFGLDIPDTRRETLEKFQGEHPIIPHILDWKTWRKMLGWRWEDFIGPDGRIHPTWNQTGTSTGRFSCKDPNLQQAPRPTPGYPNFRSLFTALPGHVWITVDWSQQEPRILAYCSQDHKMIRAANNLDIYLAIASDILGMDIDKKHPYRQRIKVGALATFYGVWHKTLAAKMHLSMAETKHFQRELYRAYPQAKRWGDYQIKAVTQYGYTKSVLGRRVYFPEISSSMLWKYKKLSRNYPIQATAADMAKLALCNIYDIIQQRGFDADLGLMLHDEIGISVHESQAQELFPIVIEEMEKAGEIICPGVKFPAEGKVGVLWDH